ncbi:glycosyltransferase [Phaeovibrio sulfidiphilus]|uniref:Glycosyltransferase n=1 Tax=Phaeovibrio sulfidiphilus TaxID=1220600 RepID=A0A8J6YMX3_9PROT|nr:glycosyltransferase [Phaeovibrio sulfidiphilus]MBE1237415.1 glycosyltransferase [Phaeovibrio sulfidiphilus]
MSMRVLQVMAGAEHGGAELFFERLCIALHRAGLQQHIVTRPAPERIRRLVDAGLAPVTLPFGGRLDFQTPIRLRKEIARFKPHLALTWMNRATRFTPPGSYALCGRLGGFYDPRYYQNCDYVICNTDAIRTHMINSGFPADRAVHLPNFAPQTRMPPVARKSLYTPEHVPVIFSLGRLHENKGFDVLLKAIARVPEVYLWLAGEGPERQALEQLAFELGIKPRIRFLGWRDDTAALYAAANLVVFPSRHEPLGNVMLEAWSHGQALISTRAQGPSALITHGENGLLVPVDDAPALTAEIRRVLADPALLEKIATGGWNTFQASYTEEKIVQAYLSFFERAVSEKNGGTFVPATVGRPHTRPADIDPAGAAASHTPDGSGS